MNACAVVHLPLLWSELLRKPSVSFQHLVHNIILLSHYTILKCAISTLYKATKKIKITVDHTQQPIFCSIKYNLQNFNEMVRLLNIFRQINLSKKS